MTTEEMNVTIIKEMEKENEFLIKNWITEKTYNIKNVFEKMIENPVTVNDIIINLVVGILIIAPIMYIAYLIYKGKTCWC